MSNDAIGVEIFRINYSPSSKVSIFAWQKTADTIDVDDISHDGDAFDDRGATINGSLNLKFGHTVSIKISEFTIIVKINCEIQLNMF